LLQRFIIAWDGKFYFAYEFDTGTLLDIEYQGPDLVLSDKIFVIPNGVAVAGIRNKPTSPQPELWLASTQ
jgi:hypothetical protein